MRPATPSTGQGLPIPEPKPTRYRVTFRFDNRDFIAHSSGYTREGAAAEAAELLRGEDGFEPQLATLTRMEVM